MVILSTGFFNNKFFKEASSASLVELFGMSVTLSFLLLSVKLWGLLDFILAYHIKKG